MIEDCFSRVGRTAPERSFAMTISENVKALVDEAFTEVTLGNMEYN